MQKNSLKRNIVSNFAGQGWSFIVGMVAIPLYIKFIGIEGYGLVGFYATLQATFNAFLDFGLSVTINREIARYTALPEKIGQTRDLVRTIEVGYWVIGLLIGAGVCLSASLIADHWIQAEGLSTTTIRNVVMIMGVVAFFQWPLTFYQGGLIGLERMVSLNTIGIVFNTLRAVGAILLLWNFSPAIMVFFLWQVVLSAFQVGVTAFLLWRYLPLSNHAPRFQIDLLLGTWRFAAGMTATSFIAFFLEQADKVILSKFLSLEFFGYYSLATTLNSQFQLIGAQIIRPLFPRFASLIAGNVKDELRNLYHTSCQFVTVVISPIAAVVALFSTRLLQIWTQDSTTASLTASIVAILFIGTALYNLLDVQYSLIIAYGWTKLSIFQQLISAVVLIPLMVTLSIKFGGVGAAATKVLLYLAYFLFIPPIVYRKFPVLEGQLMRFYITDTGLPLLTALAVAGVGYFLIPATLPTVPFLVAMVLITLTAMGAAVLSAGKIRSWAFHYLLALSKRMNPA